MLGASEPFAVLCVWHKNTLLKLTCIRGSQYMKNVLPFTYAQTYHFLSITHKVPSMQSSKNSDRNTINKCVSAECRLVTVLSSL